MKITKTHLRSIIKEELALTQEAAGNELQVLGNKISEMVVLSRQVEELMLDMGMRHGELAALGTNTRTVKKLIKEIEDIFNRKLDDIEGNARFGK